MSSICFKEHIKKDGSILAEVQLTRLKHLNVLDLDMILSLKNHLEIWHKRSEVSLIFIHSEGEKAFCAGGDVKQLYEGIQKCKEQNEDPGLFVQNFFENEYATNYLMHTYTKPIVLWGHGIVMGGGLGLFAAASHPIVTESSLFAMPEITIGLFPDVGGSYFLNQMDKGFGLYLALTACRFNATEALFLNLSQLSFKDQDKQKVFDFLLSCSFQGKDNFNKEIKKFQMKEQNIFDQENWLQKYENEIHQLVESKNIHTIYENFQKSLVQDSKWLKNKNNFLNGSPTSAGIICEQLRRGATLSLKEVFQMELVIAMQCARYEDFSEGIRALLIEKTGAPRWKIDVIDKLKDSWIQDHFKGLSGWINPLQNL